MGVAGVVPLCHSAFVGISWVQNFSSLIFRGTEFFLLAFRLFKKVLCVYFVGSSVFLEGILRVEIYFSWVFHGFKTFFCWHFVDPKFFLMGISWVQFFFSWLVS